MMSEPKALTTGEAAKYCGVSFRTVIRWIEKGRLEAFKLPGRGDNRIPVDKFIAFLKDNNMPVPGELLSGVSNRRVLVVEDQPEMAAAIRRVLRRADYEVFVAEDGFTAGAQVAELKPAVVTLDLKMPGIDGYKVLGYIRENEDLKNTRVLVVSAELEANLQRALDEGADDVLPKPFEAEELLARVAALMN